ncbi:FAD-dependent oxidoreductase [Streptomyces sp. NPDC056660]|uniref:FAD-dependent oxidoreductase n=1 Tax=Streptomyces sp. NPDC056660 TaxID=3345897 RepID=UPI0036C1F773
MPDEAFESDVLVIGSGFGGSVAALRLAEKGYRVTVIESGRHFRDEDFAASPWQARRMWWAPRLGLRGILRLRVRRRLIAVMGCGVGGGSLAYAGVHYRPGAEVFQSPAWDQAVDWDSELAPFFARAERMLGTTTVPGLTTGDTALREAAGSFSADVSVHPTRAGVFFGMPGQQVPDPYFGGQGPSRRGCTGCGQCTSGCRTGAKNTLIKNYLHLARQAGVQIRELTTAGSLEPEPGGGWRVHTVSSRRADRHEIVRARQVVLAGGAWGSAELLHRSRAYLPGLSEALGTATRTNREVMTAASSHAFDIGPGVTISSAVRLSPTTLIQLCRLAPGSHPLAGLLWPLRGPWRAFGKGTAGFLVMERGESTLNSYWQGPWGARMSFRPGTGHEPVRLAAGEAFTDHFAQLIGGRACRLASTLLRVPVTGHLMGGCPIGTHPERSVADLYHRVHGHPTLHVIDASAVPGSLGVNPALTITAMAERALAAWPQAGYPDPRAAQGQPYIPITPENPSWPAASSSPSDAPASSPGSHPRCCPPST